MNLSPYFRDKTLSVFFSLHTFSHQYDPMIPFVLIAPRTFCTSRWEEEIKAQPSCWTVCPPCGLSVWCSAWRSLSFCALGHRLERIVELLFLPTDISKSASLQCHGFAGATWKLFQSLHYCKLHHNNDRMTFAQRCVLCASVLCYCTLRPAAVYWAGVDIATSGPERAP